MKKTFILVMAVLLALAGPLTANAVVINDPWPSDNSGPERNLYNIVQDPLFGSMANYGSSNALVAAFGTVSTLPPGTGPVTAYAKYSAFAQQPGIYQSQVPGFNALFPSPFPVGPDGMAAVNIPFISSVIFGFLDEITQTDNFQYRVYTEQNLNADNLLHGIIIPVAANRVIVAFEDGAGLGQLYDQDYNDLVLNVSYTPSAPVPPAGLLMVSGLLGLVGFRQFRKN